MRKFSVWIFASMFPTVHFLHELINETPPEGTKETNQKEAFSPTNETESVSVDSKHRIPLGVHYPDY